MSDIMSAEKRSELMSKVRGKDTEPELALRKALWSCGLRYRLHADLPGKPDLAFLGPRVAVFVDGCFWHGCPEHGSIPESNSEFWERKLERNQQRDEEVSRKLRNDGWTVLRYWEHEIQSDLPRVVGEVEDVVSEQAEADA